ncbi:hypothetical protein [Microcella sp.]|uniref:hypothetical protein n=1 Tax=Microcella sp. TaxID=1913979 RepID=UPI0025606033|nr:hypothetical protein [Microcella sp.]MBX9470943.1 hypothetical protein [Microcella sp.]
MSPPESTPTAEPTPEVLVPPVSAFDLSCDDLLNPDLSSAVWGEPLSLRDGYPIQATPSGLVDAAVLHNGGLSCTWSTDGQIEPELVMMILPEAEEAFAVVVDGLTSPPYTYIPAELADGAVVACSDNYSWWGLECVWNAIRDDVWIFAAARYLPAGEATVPSPRDNPDTSRKPLVPTTEGSLVADIVESALAAVVGASRAEVPRPAEPSPTCAELFSSASASTLLDDRPVRGGTIEFTAESLGRTNQSSTGSMGFASADRLGYVECVVADSASRKAITVVAAPEAAWVFDQPNYLAPASSETVGEVTVWCPEYSCIAFAEVDGVVVTAETSTGENPTDIARDTAVMAVQAVIDSLT